MTDYTDDEMLQLSGIQHFVFCPRQWALIHIDRLWSDNRLTTEGSILHEKVDDPARREKNGSGVFTLRGLRLISTTMGLSGTADAVEIIPDEGAVTDKANLIKSRKFSVLPVEYKRGHRKINDCDRIQVVVQAMALEEMFGTEIKHGAIFYWEERHRELIEITPELRDKAKLAAESMHRLFDSHIIPKAIKTSKCRSCSLADYCMPEHTDRDAHSYITSIMNDLHNIEE